MLKRFTVILTAVFMLSICMLVPASAAVIDDPEDSPMASNYSKATAFLSISDSGTALVKGTVTGISGKTTKLSCHLYLQRYQNSKWSSVEDWSGSKSANSYILRKTKTVTEGYKYRTKAVFRAYAGSNSEKVTRYSSTVKY